MQAVAAAMTDEEIDESAKYFAQQKLAAGTCGWSRAITFRAPSPPPGSTRKWAAPRISTSACSKSRRTSRATSVATTGTHTRPMRRRAHWRAASGSSPPATRARRRSAPPATWPNSRARTRSRRSPAARLPTCCGSCSRSRMARAADESREADGARGREARARGPGGFRGLPGFAVSLKVMSRKVAHALRLAGVAAAERHAEIVHEHARAALAAAAIFVAVEEGVLLGDARASCPCPPARTRCSPATPRSSCPASTCRRSRPAASPARRRSTGLEARFGAVHELADEPVAPADAHVHFAHLLGPLVRRPGEPARLHLRLRPGAVHQRRVEVERRSMTNELCLMDRALECMWDSSASGTPRCGQPCDCAGDRGQSHAEHCLRANTHSRSVGS